MGNSFALPIVRLVRRLSMIVTLCCGAYIVYFLVAKNHDNAVYDNVSSTPTKAVGLLSEPSTVDVKLYDPSGDAQARDIFSLSTAVSPSGSVENTPKGQLPAHLKIVGIVIAHPSQIAIEDSMLNKTYFIDEGNPQAGIKIVRSSPGQMIINYQGQDISVPVSKQ